MTMVYLYTVVIIPPFLIYLQALIGVSLTKRLKPAVAKSFVI